MSPIHQTFHLRCYQGDGPTTLEWNGNANDLECLGVAPLAMIPPHALTHSLNSTFVHMGH
jgi:hypothetical protein